MRHVFFNRQFGVFLLTGGIAAAMNFGSRIVYDRYMSFSAAVIVAYATGMITAFVLARAFVFTGTTQSLHRSATRFAVVNVVAFVQTWLVSIGLAFYALPWLGVSTSAYEIAHAVGVVVPVFTSYIGHKYWSFI